MDSSDFRAEALQPILVEFECFVSLQTGTGNLTRLLASLIVIPLALHPPSCQYQIHPTSLPLVREITLPCQRHVLGCRFPVNFEFPPLPRKPSSVCLARDFV